MAKAYGVKYKHHISESRMDSKTEFDKEDFKEDALSNKRGVIKKPTKTNAEVFQDAGTLKGDQNDFNGALLDYNHSIKMDPKSAASYLDRCQIKAIIGDNRGAVRDYEKAMRLNHEIVDIYMRQGYLNEVIKKGAFLLEEKGGN